MDPYEIIATALSEAKLVMTLMVVNEGQKSILEGIVIPNFEQNAQADADQGWDPVDAGEYSSFMSEIVEAGNQIMQEAYRVANLVSKIYSFI